MATLRAFLMVGGWLASSLTVFPASLLAAKPPAQPCPAGRYLLSAALTAGASAPAGKVLQIGSEGVSIPGVCTAIAAKTLKAIEKGVTKVRVEWPVSACQGFSGKKIVVTGKITQSCTRFVGKLTGKKAKRNIRASLSSCGDGTVDVAGGRETCEPPGTATCNASCQGTPGEIVAALGIASYAVDVPTDGSLLLGPITVTLLDAAGATLGTITKTFDNGMFVSEFVSPDGEHGSLAVHVQHEDFSPPVTVRITLTIGERWLRIDLDGEASMTGEWLKTATLTTPADLIDVPPAFGIFGPGEDGAVATLAIMVDGHLVIEAADLVRWFETTGLEELGLQSFAAAALFATMSDEALALNIASHFTDGAETTPHADGDFRPLFHKTPVCASLLAAVTGGAGAIACGVCIPALIAAPALAGVPALLATPACIVCGVGVGASVTELLSCKTSEYRRTIQRDCDTFQCNAANGEAPYVDERTEHECYCKCDNDRCNTACGLYAAQLGSTFPDGTARPALAAVIGGCPHNYCECAFPADDFCKASFQNYCGGGSKPAGSRGFEYVCPRAACGDGSWNASCPANPALNEKCDPSAGAAGKKGSCGANEGCDGSCKCVTCACGPNTATPTCPVGELGGYCGPEDCQCHAGCLDEFDCPGGKECVNKTCVGAGALRFTIDWKFDTDLDLHVLTPLGNEIYYGNRSVDGGTLDVDTCVSSCTSGTENVFFQEAPVGHYEAWVQNFNGRKGGRFKLEISNGAATLPKYLFLPAAVGGTQHYSFEVSPR